MQKPSHEAPVPREPLPKLFLRFLHFGLLAWGGPVAQIAMIRHELVEKEKWISKERFNRVLAVYQALPGPEAHELCVYFGMLSRGRVGAVLAGLGFMLPGFVSILALSFIYVRFGIAYAWFAAILAGFQPAVVALIVRAVHRLGQHALLNQMLFSIAAVVALSEFCRLPFYFSLTAAGIAYSFSVKNFRISYAILVLLAVVSAVYFFLPSAESAAIASLAQKPNPSALSLFIYGLRTGLLTFGGAYTAIPFLRHDAVVTGAWMTNAQFLDGLALSGILPAPLIIFATFVGFLGGGFIGAVTLTAGVFLPAFGFTLFGHEALERLINHRPLHAFLDGLTAGVVGMIAVTALRFMPAAARDFKSLLLFALSLLVLYLWKNKASAAAVVITSGLLGLLLFN